MVFIPIDWQLVVLSLLSAALQASYVDRRLAWEKLTFGDQIDPKTGFVNITRETEPGKLSKGYLDFSTGIIGYSENFYAGVAISHLTQPEDRVHYNSQTSYEIYCACRSYY